MSPLVQNYGHIQAIKNIIDLKYHELFISMVSFTKRCTFKIDEELRKIQSNELVDYDIELTEFINRKVAITKIIHKEPILSDQDIESIYNTLLDANISNPEIRKQHVENIKNQRYESGGVLDYISLLVVGFIRQTIEHCSTNRFLNTYCICSLL